MKTKNQFKPTVEPFKKLVKEIMGEKLVTKH